MENNTNYRYCREKKIISDVETIVQLYKYDTVSNVKVGRYRIKCEGIEFFYREQGLSMNIFTDIKYKVELDDMEEVSEFLYNYAFSYIKETQKIVSDTFVNCIY